MRSNRRLLVVAAAVAAATLAIAVAVIAARRTPSSSGPFNLGVESSETFGAFDTGTVVSFGSAFIKNEGTRAATIDDITFSPPDKDIGAAVTGVYVVDTTTVRTLHGLASSFPPPNSPAEWFVPARGAVIAADTTYQVVFVVRIDRPGEWLFPSYEVKYHVAGRAYRAVGPHALRVCAPRGVACGKMPAISPSSGS